MWRDGIHIAGTPIWCDARRAREVCFASRYEAVPAARHGQLVATAATLALYGDGAAGAVLSSPFGRPFTLGTVRLELIPAGAGLGSASLWIDVGGTRVVYGGAIGRGEGMGGAGERRPADVVVLAVEHGDPDERFPLLEDAVGWIADQWAAARRAGGAVAVVVASALDALDLLAGLGPHIGHGLSAPADLHAAIERARAAGAALPAIRRHGRVAPGDCLIWPARRHAALARVALPSGSRRLAVSADPPPADAALRWSLIADAATALAYIEDSGARAIYLAGRAGPALAARLGAGARPLGPPVQMSLF